MGHVRALNFCLTAHAGDPCADHLTTAMLSSLRFDLYIICKIQSEMSVLSSSAAPITKQLAAWIIQSFHKISENTGWNTFATLRLSMFVPWGVRAILTAAFMLPHAAIIDESVSSNILLEP